MMKKKQNTKDSESARKDCLAAFEEIQRALNTVALNLQMLEEDLHSLKIYNARMLEVFGTPNYGKEFII